MPFEDIAQTWAPFYSQNKSEFLQYLFTEERNVFRMFSGAYAEMVRGKKIIEIEKLDRDHKLALIGEVRAVFPDLSNFDMVTFCRCLHALNFLTNITPNK